MKTSINVGTFPRGTPIDQMISETSRAGFDAIELIVATDGPLGFETSEADCIRVAKCAANAGLAISGIMVEGHREANFASVDPAARQTAYDRARAALDRAAWLGTDAVVIVPAIVGKPAPPQPGARYEDAYSLALEAMLALRFEAAQRAVHLACAGCPDRFLPSPLEMRDFIDRVNSCWVGVCLDLARVMPFGFPQDWIRSLGCRVVRVHFGDFNLAAPGPGGRCGLGDGLVNWAEVMALLRQIRYDGPATYLGRGDPADIARRLAGVLRPAD